VIAGRVEFAVWGTTALLVVEDSAGLAQAQRILHAELAAVDAACSRFRSDSEISVLQAHAGTPQRVSPLLGEAITVALRAAQVTGGLVDPTVGAALRGLGYDRDFAALSGEASAPAAALRPAPGWWRVDWDPQCSRVLLPREVLLDFGATAKALAADRAAAQITRALGCGVLVSLGGDIAVAGSAPAGGWRIAVAEDHTLAQACPQQIVTIGTGGLATSSTTRRRWRRGGRWLHHIVDPRTGDIPDSPWRTVSVAAGSCVDANTASTAALICSCDAAGWLQARKLPARLIDQQGQVCRVAGWPPGDRNNEEG
jgi:thiamine biosynthesis lipoprotein